MKVYGITSEIGTLLKNIASQSSILTVFLFGFSSAFVANIVNNIPMTIAYVPIIQAFSSNLELPALFATAVGSNLGANITPIGALAGIMWMTILRNKDVNIYFREFVKYGFIVTPFTLFICLYFLTMEFLLI